MVIIIIIIMFVCIIGSIENMLQIYAFAHTTEYQAIIFVGTYE